MSILTKVLTSAVYPEVARVSTTRHQIAAADHAQLHPLAPRTGGDGAAAGRPLRLLQRPPLRCDGVTNWRTNREPYDQVVQMQTAAVQRMRDGADACGRSSGRS